MAYSLRDSLELFRELDIPILEVRAGGGGARSLVWRQILADVFSVELTTVNVADSTAFGAALLAGVGAGLYSGVPEACAATIRIVDRLQPIAANQTVYNNYYPIYHSLYPALKPAYDQLARTNES